MGGFEIHIEKRANRVAEGLAVACKRKGALNKPSKILSGVSVCSDGRIGLPVSTGMGSRAHF